MSAKDELGSFEPTKHSCHATGCDERVPPRLLMCARHWRMVPANLQAEVWRTYRRGQETDKRPTREYLAAARAAIEAAAAKERPRDISRGRTTTAPPAHEEQRPARAGRLFGLTLHRPWAWAIAHDRKRVENRTWLPTVAVGSFIAIHAGKKWDDEAALELSLHLAPRCPLDHSEHPLGIVAVARLARVIDCRRESVPEDQDPWTVGPYAWLLDDVVALHEPIEATGQQGLWAVEGALLERVRRGWDRARRSPCDSPTTDTVAPARGPLA